MIDPVGLILLDKRVPQPILTKQVGGDSEWRTYGARISRHRHPALPGWAHIWYRPSGPRGWFSSTVSHAGTHEALALPPALERMIRIETLSRSAKAPLIPH